MMLPKRQTVEAYTQEELMDVADHALPTRGPVCPKCGAHIPQFVDLSEKDKARLRELIRNDRKAMATQELRAITRCPLSWAKLWVSHSGRPDAYGTTALCPHCGKRRQHPQWPADVVLIGKIASTGVSVAEEIRLCP